MFQKGKSGNPGGRVKMPEDVKELKKIGRVEIERSLSKFLLLTLEQLEKKKADPQATVIDLFIISILKHGLKNGDPIRLNFLLDRLIGKVDQNITVIQRPLQHETDEEIDRRLALAERGEALPAREPVALIGSSI